MFWVGILILVAIVVGTSVLVGNVLNRRQRTRRNVSREEMAALKTSGAFPHRKSGR